MYVQLAIKMVGECKLGNVKLWVPRIGIMWVEVEREEEKEHGWWMTLTI